MQRKIEIMSEVGDERALFQSDDDLVEAEEQEDLSVASNNS